MAHQFFLTGEDEDMVQRIIDYINTDYTTQETSLPAKLAEFHLLNDYLSKGEYRTIRITQRSNATFVSFIETHAAYSTRSGTASAHYLQAYVFVKLSRQYGHLVIKKETLRDKLSELFQPLEIDFEDDKQFSRQFYVLAKDKDKALQLITQNFRDELRKIRTDVYIEVVNDVMMVGNKKGAAHQSLFELLDFGYKISCIK
jgi:hypothetical protein